MKRIITATLLSTALLVAPLAQAASYQDRTMATGAVVGATTGAVVGSGSNQMLEGAIIGAVFGTIAGAVIGNQHQPVYVTHQSHHQYKPVAHRYERRDYRPSYSRSHNRRDNRHVEYRGRDREYSHRGDRD